MMYGCIAIIIGCLVVWIVAGKYRKQEQVKLYCLVMAASSVLSMAILFGNGEVQNAGSIPRKLPGEGTKTESYRLQVEELQLDEMYELTVENRHLSDTEKKELFEKAFREAKKQFLGNNQSENHVDHDVNLVKRVCDGMVKVSFRFDHYHALDMNGKLLSHVPKEGSIVEVTTDLSYENEHVTNIFYIQVFPKKLSETEQFFVALQAYFDTNNQKTGELFILPKELNGYHIHWSKPQSSLPVVVLLFGTGSCVALAIGKRMDEKKLRQQRKELLLQEYPQMLSQMSLLLSAGMTTSHAWGKIVTGYEHSRRVGNTKEQPVYEEMAITGKQMKDGIGEREAYEQFARRLGLPCYRRFASLLVQNLRKGTSGLSLLLEKEVENAFAEQESRIKKKGEELETKLLGPMMVMLLLVIVLILLPATSGFQFE